MAFWAVLVTIIRFVFERVIAGPIGKAMGLKDSQRATSPPPYIEVRMSLFATFVLFNIMFILPFQKGVLKSLLIIISSGFRKIS